MQLHNPFNPAHNGKEIPFINLHGGIHWLLRKFRMLSATKRSLLTALTVFLVICVNASQAQPNFVYYDSSAFTIIGRGFQNSGYSRLPSKYKPKLRPEVWSLSLHASGIGIRFSTNSTTISVKWKTGNKVHFPHAAETLIKGVDLYARRGGKWFFAGVGKPYDAEYNEAVLVREMDSTMKDFILNLPNYETVDSVYIGIEPFALIKKPAGSGFGNAKPIVFYGTSITQGASAMRPGMAYTAILERHLNTETINLGFSGNGLLETELADIMGDIASSCYVIDCGGNLTPQFALERTGPFIKHLRQKAPGVPILLVGHLYFTHGRFNRSIRKSIDSINVAFREAYLSLKKQEMEDLYFLPGENLIGTDGEATVDGAHLTDVGFMRIAEQMEERLKKILK